MFNLLKIQSTKKTLIYAYNDTTVMLLLNSSYTPEAAPMNKEMVGVDKEDTCDLLGIKHTH